jgi:hypothetical protein
MALDQSRLSLSFNEIERNSGLPIVPRRRVKETDMGAQRQSARGRKPMSNFCYMARTPMSVTATSALPRLGAAGRTDRLAENALQISAKTSPSSHSVKCELDPDAWS